MFDTDSENLVFLETILAQLEDGIVVCDREATILFHNPAARDLLESKGDIDRRSLAELFPGARMVDTLAGLLQNRSTEKKVTCHCPKTGRSLECRLNSFKGPGHSPDLFLLLFPKTAGGFSTPDSEITAHCTIIENLRAPLANLRSAAENLVTHQDMSPVLRSGFENVIAQESTTLTEQFKTMAVACRALAARQQQLPAVYSADLLRDLTDRLAVAAGPAITAGGSPGWLRADKANVVETIEVLIRLLIDYIGRPELEIRQKHHNDFVYLDIIWEGDPVPSAEIKAWRLTNLRGEDTTLEAVLKKHSSDIWSQPSDRAGYAMLRLPLPSAPPPTATGLMSDGTTNPVSGDSR